MTISCQGNALGQRVNLPDRPEWPVQPGQIIDPNLKKPLVGDYDLMDVVDPRRMGQNVSHSRGGDRTNPIVDRVRNLINQAIGQERVMHGAHGNFGSIDSACQRCR